MAPKAVAPSSASKMIGRRSATAVVSHLLVFIAALLSVEFANAQAKISAGGFNTCAVLSTNALKCFGQGAYTGRETTVDVGNTAGSMGSNLPAINLGTNIAIKSVSVNGDSSTGTATVCAIAYDTSAPSTTFIKCFGNNAQGKCGRGINSAGSNLTFGDELGEMNVALLKNVDLGTGLLPDEVSVGVNHVCAIVSTADLSVNRRVKCWGKGSTGALGNGGSSSFGAVASGMGDSLPFFNITSKTLAIGSGEDFTCIIASDSSSTSGNVFCTGDGTKGRTGLETSSTTFSPVQVNIGSGKTASKLAVGQRHVCVLIAEDSQIKCWGDSSNHQNGEPSDTDVGDSANSMSSLANLNFGSGLTVLDVKAGSFHTCVILSNNGLRCFGNAYNGQTASGDQCNNPCSTGSLCTFTFCSNPRATVADLPTISLGSGVTVTGLSLGGAHSCALVTGSFAGTRMKCWGRGFNGETGHENGNDAGSGSSQMGDSLPFTFVGEPTLAPTQSPTTSRPSVSPTKSPTTARPSRSPTTHRPSTNPSKVPSKGPTVSKAPTQSPITKAPTSIPSRNPTLKPTTKAPSVTPAPTLDTAAATGQTVGIAAGSVVGFLALALLIFVVVRRSNNSSGGSSGAVKNWYAEALATSPGQPATVAATTTAPQGNKYNIPPAFNEQTGTLYESGNPVYAGIRATSQRSNPAANPAPVLPPKLSREQVFDKLTNFYAKIDPGKNVKDISDLADWVTVYGEEALYIKLRKKYGLDPNSIVSTPTQPKLKFADEVDV